MKILAAIALIMASTAVHADTLPKEMLGNWCELDLPAGRGQIWERRICDRQLRLKQTGFSIKPIIDDPEGYACEFKKISKIPNNFYFIHAECGSECVHVTENMVLGIEDKQLKMIIITSKTDRSACD
jgi:hypothetical protein